MLCSLEGSQHEHHALKHPQMVIYSSLLKENTGWKKVFSFDEIHGVRDDQCEIDPLHPPFPSG